MSCCAPSITPDFAEDGGGGGGGGGGVQSVIAGTNVTVTGGSANPVINAFTSGTIVNSVSGVTGAVTLTPVWGECVSFWCLVMSLDGSVWMLGCCVLGKGELGSGCWCGLGEPGVGVFCSSGVRIR